MEGLGNKVVGILGNDSNDIKYNKYLKIALLMILYFSML